MHSALLKNRAIVHYKYFLRSLRKVASIYKIGKSTLNRWLQEDGIEVKRKKRGSILCKISETIKDEVTLNPFVTASELSYIIMKNLKLNVSPSSCWRCIRKNNFTRKRARVQVTKVNKNQDVDNFKKLYYNSKNFISIDETFFYITDYPKYGYSKKGKQLKLSTVNNPRKRKITLYMAISQEKIVGYKLSNVHGNSTDFISFLQQLNLDSNTLLMDNVSFHKTKNVRVYVAGTNSSILLIPPYSPEYNPIELAFSKIKSCYRKSCFQNDDMVKNILKSLNNVTNRDIVSFFCHVDNLIHERAANKNLIIPK